VVPLFMGGVDDFSNLQALCATCHAYKSSVERDEFYAAQKKNKAEPSSDEEEEEEDEVEEMQRQKCIERIQGYIYRNKGRLRY